MAGQWAGSRLMVVVTERTSEDEPVAGALRDVVRRLAGAGAAGHRRTWPPLVARSGLAYDAERLYSWTGGSPLFVTELLRHPAPSSVAGGGRAGDRARLAARGGGRADRARRRADRRAARAGRGARRRRSRWTSVAALSGLDVEDCARWAGRALRAGLLVAPGATASGSPTTSSARWPTSPPRNRSGSAGTGARPGCWRTARGRRPAPRRGRRLARRGAGLDGRRAHRAPGLRQHRGRSSCSARPCDAAQHRRRHPPADRGAAAPGPRAHRPRPARTPPARDHEAALELARDRRRPRAGGPRAGAAGLDRALRPRRDARRRLRRAGHRAGRVGRRRARRTAQRDAAARPGAALGRRVRRRRGGLRPGAGRDRGRTPRPRSRWPTAARCCSTRTGSPRRVRCWPARRCCAGAPAQFRPMLQTLFFTALARGDTGDFAGALRALDNARRLIDAEKVGFYRAGIETTTSWLVAGARTGAPRQGARRAWPSSWPTGAAARWSWSRSCTRCSRWPTATCCSAGRSRPAAAVAAAAPMLERSLPFRPRAAMRLLEMRSRWEPELAEALL